MSSVFVLLCCLPLTDEGIICEVTVIDLTVIDGRPTTCYVYIYNRLTPVFVDPRNGAVKEGDRVTVICVGETLYAYKILGNARMR